jgi:hypothetical protein
VQLPRLTLNAARNRNVPAMQHANLVKAPGVAIALLASFVAEFAPDYRGAIRHRPLG